MLLQMVQIQTHVFANNSTINASFASDLTASPPLDLVWRKQRDNIMVKIKKKLLGR